MTVDHRFDPATGQVRRDDGQVVSLRAQAAELLSHLVAQPGEVVSKDTLMQAVWPDTAVTENSLYQCITEIRKALGPDGDKILQTVPRKGYRLMLPEIDAPAPAPRRGLPLLVALAAALVVVGLAIWLLVPRAPALAEGPSIVILPFEAAEDDPRWTRIGAGLSAEIAGVLARNDWLDVIAPHSAERVGTRDAPEAADRLDVRYVLSGTIQVAGDSLRVSAALLDAASDRVLWSARWQRPQDEVFDVQDEILMRIQAALSSSFSGVLGRSERLRAQSGPAGSLSAFEYFLLGIEQKVLFTPAVYRQSIAYLEQAVALDPDYAEAWATLSLVYDWLARTTVPGDEEWELRDKERRAGLRGFAADPSNPTVLWRMSQIATNFQDDRGLGRAFVRRAVEVAPGNADTLLAAAWLGPFLGIWGEDPRQWSERARALNPDAPVWYDIGHGLAAFSAGDYEAAVDTLRTAPRTDATLFFLALAHMNLGDIDEAQRIKTELLGKFPNFSVESLIGPIAPGDQSMDPVVTPAQALGFAMRPPGGLAYLAAR